MKALHFFRSMLLTLTRNKIRATLMMAGVTIGIASLIILTSIGESTRRETMKRFKNMLGTFDTLIIRPGSSKNRGMVSLTNVEPSLKFEDAAAIATQIPEIRQVAQVQNALDIDVKYQGHNGTPAIFGVSSNWPELRGDNVRKGPFSRKRTFARWPALPFWAQTHKSSSFRTTIQLGRPFASEMSHLPSAA
jgi:putative ABC transport system permease protein